MAQEYSAFGIQLAMGDGAGPEVFTNIAQIQKLSGPGFTFDLLDVTSHDSPGFYEEIIPTIIRSDQCTMKILYDPATATHNNATGLIMKNRTRAKTNFKMTFPTAGNPQWQFAAYVMKFTPTGDVDGALEAEVVLKPTGAPTLV